MNTVRLETQKIINAILPAALALLAGAGCQREAQPVATGLQPPPPPAVLREARLLFHRPDGIYLARPFDGNERLVTPDASYPRWLPDGKRFVFIRDSRIMLHHTGDGSERELAHGQQVRAVAVNPINGNVLFAAADGVHRIDIATGGTQRLIPGKRAYELAARGNVLVVTEQLPLRGFGIRRYTLPSTSATLLGRGCSASLSPDGTLATLNLDGHRELAILEIHSGAVRKTLPAPPGMQLDNQYWSGHPDWIAAVSHSGDILLQRVADAAAWQITTTGDADRPDLFIP